MAWAIVIVMVTFIYATLSLARSVWDFFTASFSYPSIRLFVGSLFILVGLFFLLYLLLKVKEKRLSPYFSLFSLGLVTFLCTKLFIYPSEWVHFIEYGLLAFLVFNALSHDLRGRDLYTYSALLVFFIGLGDECLQMFLPNRGYDSRDLVLNGLGGLLALLLKGFVLAKEEPIQ